MSELKARETMAMYTETIPVFRDMVGYMDIDVASMVMGHAIYSYNADKLDRLEVSASKRNIEFFVDFFGIDKMPKLNLNFSELPEKNEVVGLVWSLSDPKMPYDINFPFCMSDTYFSNSQPAKMFSTKSPRNNPDTGANFIVDKYEVVLGDKVVDKYEGVIKIRNYGLFGSLSHGYIRSGKVINQIGVSRESYSKVPKSGRTHKLINERFPLKRVNFREDVIKYKKGL